MAWPKYFKPALVLLLLGCSTDSGGSSKPAPMDSSAAVGGTGAMPPAIAPTQAPTGDGGADGLGGSAQLPTPTTGGGMSGAPALDPVSCEPRTIRIVATIEGRDVDAVFEVGNHTIGILGFGHQLKMDGRVSVSSKEKLIGERTPITLGRLSLPSPDPLVGVEFCADRNGSLVRGVGEAHYQFDSLLALRCPGSAFSGTLSSTEEDLTSTAELDGEVFTDPVSSRGRSSQQLSFGLPGGSLSVRVEDEDASSGEIQGGLLFSNPDGPWEGDVFCVEEGTFTQSSLDFPITFGVNITKMSRIGNCAKPPSAGVARVCVRDDSLD